MKRTSRRPLVNKQGVITPAAALIWGIVLGAGATALLGLAANWLAAVAGRRRDPLLRLRLHAAAQAPFRVEHRDRRRRRLLPGPGRLGGGQGHDRDPGDRAVRGDLPLDPAALLGPGDEVQGRLRPRQRPHAPGGGVARRRDPQDRHLLVRDGRRDPGPGPLRRLALHRRRRRPRRLVPPRGPPPARPGHRRRRPPLPDAPVPPLHRLPDPPVRSRSRLPPSSQSATGKR